MLWPVPSLLARNPAPFYPAVSGTALVGTFAEGSLNHSNSTKRNNYQHELKNSNDIIELTALHVNSNEMKVDLMVTFGQSISLRVWIIANGYGYGSWVIFQCYKCCNHSHLIKLQSCSFI